MRILKVLNNREYITAMYIVVMGMIVSGFIRPLVIFNVLGSQGLLHVSLLTLGFMLSRGISSLYISLMIRRYGYRISGLIALVLWCISITIYTYTPLHIYPLIRVLEGFSSGLLWPLMQSLVSISIPKEYCSRAISLYFIAGSLSYNVGIWIGGFIEKYWGKELLYLTTLVILIIMIISYDLISLNCNVNTEWYIRKKRVKTPIGRVLSEIANIIPLIVIVGGLSGLSIDYILAYVKSVSGHSDFTVRTLWSYTGYIALIIGYILSHILDKYPSKIIPYTISYITVLSLAFLSLRLPLELMYLITILPRMCSFIFKPIIRGFTVKTSSDPEIVVALVNSLSNISAALTPLVIVFIDKLAKPTHILNSLGLSIYTLISIILLIILNLSKSRST